jgi:EmrB/QacA subfamily drug resistance transporter
MGVLLATIDGSIVNIALPTMVDAFDTTFAVIQWVSLAYLLALATLTLGIGRLGDIVGKKRIYTAGFAAFTIASMLCGLAPTVGALIAARVVQAVGATMILALGVSILTESFPASERGKAIGFIGTAVSIGIVTGPVAGGLLIAAFDWRAIFFVNLPVGIVGTVMARRYVPDLRPVPGQKMDYRGAGLLGLALLCLSLGLTLSQDRGLGSPTVLGLLGTAIVAGALFAAVEIRHPTPMIDLRLFRNPLLTVSIVTGFMSFVVLSATFLLLPFYLEGVLGFEVRRVGLLLGAAPLVLGVVAPMSGTLSDRMGVRKLTLAGLLVLVAAYAGFSTLGVDTGVAHYLALAVPIGLGIGVFQSPNNSAIMGSVPREYSGLAGGLLTITRLLGQISGVAVLGSIWAARVSAANGGVLPGGDATRAPDAAQVAGLHDTFLVGAALLLVAAGVTVWGLRREQTDVSRVPSREPQQ